MDTGEPLSTIRDRILSANAYIGAFPLAEALATGADVVIAGRCTDTALALAPMIHRFGWKRSDWDMLAAGTIAGHIIECGAQCTGGNCQVDWTNIPDMANIGYPIVEAEPDGIIRDHETSRHRRPHQHRCRERTAPLRTRRSANVHHARLRRRFHHIRLRNDGPDRVRVSGIRGGPRTDTLKLSISYCRWLEGHRHARL